MTAQAIQSGQNRDLSHDNRVIGISAIADTTLDGVVGMNSGMFNNPFIA